MLLPPWAPEPQYPGKQKAYLIFMSSGVCCLEQGSSASSHPGPFSHSWQGLQEARYWHTSPHSQPRSHKAFTVLLFSRGHFRRTVGSPLLSNDCKTARSSLGIQLWLPLQAPAEAGKRPEPFLSAPEASEHGLSQLSQLLQPHRPHRGLAGPRTPCPEAPFQLSPQTFSPMG